MKNDYDLLKAHIETKERNHQLLKNDESLLDHLFSASHKHRNQAQNYYQFNA